MISDVEILCKSSAIMLCSPRFKNPQNPNWGSLGLHLSEVVGLSWGLTSTIPVTRSAFELGVH